MLWSWDFAYGRNFVFIWYVEFGIAVFFGKQSTELFLIGILLLGGGAKALFAWYPQAEINKATFWSQLKGGAERYGS